MAGSRNNNQTLILSQPQGSKSSLVVITMDGIVKVKQRIINNSRRSNENNPNEVEVEVIISSNYAVVDEDSDPEASNDEIQEAPSQLEDGGHATVDELKELNLDFNSGFGISEVAPLGLSSTNLQKGRNSYQ
ncbi:hypothetical protein BUALT_Bualt01G0128300 [Buddleja alternifolia]|uniref:Uncharacterized protein n=1 Tax=Buddleja alternifolia TaxID=168488 RepID=A0AAV6YCK8_9LAMI|nr:hypothetical protein BUALT_Bualt01G0128300 [Buddleja alternifolia]